MFELIGFLVVVEKPFVTSSAKADELIQLAKEKNKILTVFHSEWTRIELAGAKAWES